MRTRSLLLLLPLTLTACGGGGSFGTSIPPETVLDEATPEELMELCLAISDEFLRLVEGPLTRAVCTGVGVALDSAFASCREIRSECIAEAAPPEVASCDNINPAAFDACDTTVGEVEQCMFVLRTNITRIERQLTCSLEAEDLENIDVENVLPADCIALGAECPALGMLFDFQLAIGG